MVSTKTPRSSYDIAAKSRAYLNGDTTWRESPACSLREAEDLLDWAKAQGYSGQVLVILKNGKYAVRWK